MAALVAGLEGRGQDARYLGYFECFNRGLFYEAHDVLEDLWLISRPGPKDHFYKGLIQFAGAFVHLQKNRLKPAGALFRLSRRYLSKYPPRYDFLDLNALLALGMDWERDLESTSYQTNPLSFRGLPQLHLTLDEGLGAAPVR